MLFVQEVTEHNAVDRLIQPSNHFLFLTCAVTLRDCMQAIDYPSDVPYVCCRIQAAMFTYQFYKSSKDHFADSLKRRADDGVPIACSRTHALYTLQKS